MTAFEDLLARAHGSICNEPGYVDKKALLDRAFASAADDPFACVCMGVSMLFGLHQVTRTEMFIVPGAEIVHASEFDALGHRWRMTLTQVKE